MNYLNAIALLPIYDDYGYNCTKLLFSSNHTRQSSIPTHTLIAQMHTHFRLSYEANIKWASYYLLEKSRLPIIFDKTHVFLRCQIRKNVPKGDGCYGYISLFEISNIEGSTIFLKNGMSIPTQSSFKQLIKSFQQTTMLYFAYLGTQGPSPSLPLHTDQLLHSLSQNFKSKSSVTLL